MTTTKPKQDFEALVSELLTRIDAIDRATPWTPRNEPGWWLAMARLRDETYRAKYAMETVKTPV